MNAETPPIGIDHPTVVPGNFDPDEQDRPGKRSEPGVRAHSRGTNDGPEHERTE